MSKSKSKVTDIKKAPSSEATESPALDRGHIESLFKRNQDELFKQYNSASSQLREMEAAVDSQKTTVATLRGALEYGAQMAQQVLGQSHPLAQAPSLEEPLTPEEE